MDPLTDAAAFSSRSLPLSYPSPLALSDFLSQQQFPSYDDDDDDRIAVDTETPVSREHDVGFSQSPAIQQHFTHDLPEAGTPKDAFSSRQEGPQAIPTEQQLPSAPVNWLATRRQLAPSKNIGKKGDWIRGWSESVSVYGDTAYCACSESSAVKKSREGKNALFRVGVRAILRRSPPVRQQRSSSPKAEANLCYHCGRPTLPAVVNPSILERLGKSDTKDLRELRKMNASDSGEAGLPQPSVNDTSQSTGQNTPGPAPTTETILNTHVQHAEHAAPAANATTNTPPAAGSDGGTSTNKTSGNADQPRGDDWIKRAKARAKKWKGDAARQPSKN